MGYIGMRHIPTTGNETRCSRDKRRHILTSMSWLMTRASGMVLGSPSLDNDSRDMTAADTLLVVGYVGE